MTTEDCFDFRCFFDDDVEEASKLLSSTPNFDIPNAQWYCLEADECGESLLAIAQCIVDLDQQVCTVHPVAFDPCALPLQTKAGVSAPKNFFSQLRNVGAQLGVHTMQVHLSSYDEVVVLALESLGFTETGGHFSDELQAMIHQFSFQYQPRNDLQTESAESLAADLAAVSFVTDQDDSSAPEGEMKTLIESLFTALHKSEA